MSRLRRTALVVACCSPAGLFVGCGQSNQPARLTPPVIVKPIAAPVPAIREPRLLAVPQDVRPVAGDFLGDAPGSEFRYSDRLQQGAAAANVPQRIASPESAAPISEPQPTTVVRPQVSMPRETLPAQTGPYPLERQPAPVPAFPAAFPVAALAPSSPPAFAPPPFERAAGFTPAGIANPNAGRPVMGPARDPRQFQAVSERVMALNYQAIRLANRGAIYAAKQDLQQALRMATQSLDAAEGTSGYGQALEQGFTALREAEDFALHGAEATQPLQVEQIVAGHKTPVLHELNGQQVSPVVAMQQYYGYAGQRLSVAVGELPAAADSLFWLGKVHNSLARQSVQADRLQGPQAMVCFRAALAAAPQHYLAANELGVLFAKYGELNEAKKLLQQSVAMKPHVEGWQNLAIVHSRLGESQLAELATQESTTLLAQVPAGKSAPVTWVDAKTFAATGDQGPEPPAASRPATGPVANQPNPSARR